MSGRGRKRGRGGRATRPAPLEPEIVAAHDADPEPAALEPETVELPPPEDAVAEITDDATPLEEGPLRPVRRARGDDDGRGALVSSDPLQRYLAEIRRHPLLTRQEEHDLAVRYQKDRDIEAAYRLVTGNLRLVVMIAREYQRSFRTLLDLIQEGNIGLMEAVKNFDPYRGVRFPSYAVWWIRAYIIRYIMNNWRHGEARHDAGAAQALLQSAEGEGQARGRGLRRRSEAPRRSGSDVKEKEVIEMEQRLGASDLSVDIAAARGRGGHPPRRAEERRRHGRGSGRRRPSTARASTEKIREFGATLHDKDRVIFDQRLLAEEPLTLQEIGDKYGISRERVRQVESRLKRRLKEYLATQFEDLRDVS